MGEKKHDKDAEDAPAGDGPEPAAKHEAFKAKLGEVADSLEREKEDGKHAHVAHSLQATRGGPGSLRPLLGGPVTNDAVARIWAVISPMGEHGLEMLLNKLAPFLP